MRCCRVTVPGQARTRAHTRSCRECPRPPRLFRSLRRAPQPVAAASPRSRALYHQVVGPAATVPSVIDDLSPGVLLPVSAGRRSTWTTAARRRSSRWGRRRGWPASSSPTCWPSCPRSRCSTTGTGCWRRHGWRRCARRGPAAPTPRICSGGEVGWPGAGSSSCEATRVQVDLWVRTQQAGGAGDARVRRRLSGIGSFYRYCLLPRPGGARIRRRGWRGRGWTRTTPPRSG